MDSWREYERVVVASWGSTPGQAMDHSEHRGPHLGLAIAGEAGEVAEMFKKAHRERADCGTIDVQKLLDELGDVLWAVASIAVWTGHSLDDVRNRNTVKMYDRHDALVRRETV